MRVIVHDGNVEQAIRVLKKQMQREGIYRKLKLCSFYEPPSRRRVREKAESVRRIRKVMRKRFEREGY